MRYQRPAALGMTAIKVVSPEQALEDLENVVGLVITR